MKRAWSQLLLIFIGVLCLMAQPARQKAEDKIEQPARTAREQSTPEGHHNHQAPVLDELMNPETRAKLLADKRESEFNHHLAGLFVAVGGAFILLKAVLGKRWTLAKYIWPASFLASGIFVFVWSDTELWPFGDRQWLEALQHNREVLQHKIFAVLLLGLGSIEWLHVKETWKAAWSQLVFPALAIAGSILLLFHQHESGMHGADHMELMARIQSQHLSYAVIGIGIGVAKGAAELRISGRKIFAKLWPMLMIALGILLMFYHE